MSPLPIPARPEREIAVESATGARPGEPPEPRRVLLSGKLTVTVGASVDGHQSAGKGETMTAIRLAAATFILALPALAFAGPGTSQVPEPETLAVLAVGAVALVVARRRKR